MSVRVARNPRKFRRPGDVLEIRVDSLREDDRGVVRMLRSAYREARLDGIRPGASRTVAIGVVVVAHTVVGTVTVDRDWSSSRQAVRGMSERLSDEQVARCAALDAPDVTLLAREVQEYRAMRCDGCAKWERLSEVDPWNLCNEYDQLRREDDCCRLGFVPKDAAT